MAQISQMYFIAKKLLRVCRTMLLLILQHTTLQENITKNNLQSQSVKHLRCNLIDFPYENIELGEGFTVRRMWSYNGNHWIL